MIFKEIPASEHSLSCRRKIYGIGINDADYQVYLNINGKRITCPYYKKWTSMLARCYSVKTQKMYPTYAECTVCDEWLVFSEFKLWMKTQDWRGKVLDKDVLIQGNKVYSPIGCLFISNEINNLINGCKSKESALPQGVTANSKCSGYRANTRREGKRLHVGSFKTPELAFNAYKTARYEVIKEVAIRQKEPLMSALLNYKIK